MARFDVIKIHGFGNDVVAGAASWRQALVMMAGGLIGGFAGGTLANWLPADRERMIVTAVGTVLTVAYFVNG